MSGINFILGARFNNFVLLSADKQSFAHGMLLEHADHDKHYQLGTKLDMVALGEGGDVAHYCEYIRANLKLFAVRQGYEPRPKAAAHFARKELADALRTADGSLVDFIIGGWDDISKETYLCSCDYLANHIDSANFAFRGFSGKFCYSIFDNLYKPDMDQAQAVEVVTQCLKEVNKRFVANLRTFSVAIVDENGVRRLDDVKL